MKRLILVVILAALTWAGWWFWSAQTLKADITAWFEARESDGWVATYSDLTVRGFPNRLDLTISDVTLANPQTNVLWQAPFIQIFALTYKHDHKIVAFPNVQTVTVAARPHEITSEGLRASLVLTQDGVIDRLNVEADVLNWDGVAIANAKAALLRQEAQRYQFGFVAETIARAGGKLTPLSETRVDDTQINTVITFDKDWTLSALQDGRPQPREIDVTLMSYKMASLELDLAGDLAVDPSGRASGKLTLRAANWQTALEQARLGDHLPGSITEKLVQGLSIVAGLKGRADTLDLPLTLQRGQMSLGLIPLGPAPLFQIP